MNIELTLIVINATIIGALLLSIIYTAGVVWRVEKKLDISYKFFLAATIFLFAGETLNLYYALDNTLEISLTIKILRMLFALCFLTGIVIMRKIVRKLDGELKEDASKKLKRKK
jgi:hypothetical protein